MLLKNLAPCVQGRWLTVNLAWCLWSADPRSGAAGSALDVTGFQGNLHRVNVKTGILKERSLNYYKIFFRKEEKDKVSVFGQEFTVFAEADQIAMKI